MGKKNTIGGIAAKKSMRAFPLSYPLAEKMFDIIMEDFDRTKPFVREDIWDEDMYFNLYEAEMVSVEKIKKFKFLSLRWRRGLTPYRVTRLTNYAINNKVNQGILGKRIYGRSQRRRTPFGGDLCKGKEFYYYVEHFKEFPPSHLAKISPILQSNMDEEEKEKVLLEIETLDNPVQCKNYMGLKKRCKVRFEYVHNKKFCDSCKKIRNRDSNKRSERRKTAKERKRKGSLKRHKKTYVHKTIRGWINANQELHNKDPKKFLKTLAKKVDNGELK